MKRDAFGARRTFETGTGPAALYRLDALFTSGVAAGASLDRLPFSIKVLLEAVLRNVDGELVTEDDVRTRPGTSSCPTCRRG
jgi:aconitate hydratase